jgi:hypothetical protein
MPDCQTWYKSFKLGGRHVTLIEDYNQSQQQTSDSWVILTKVTVNCDFHGPKWVMSSMKLAFRCFRAIFGSIKQLQQIDAHRQHKGCISQNGNL